jgi:hypothetical protein
MSRQRVSNVSATCLLLFYLIDTWCIATQSLAAASLYRILSLAFTFHPTSASILILSTPPSTPLPPPGGNPAGSSNTLIKTLRIFRLLKLTRVLKFGKYIEKIEDFLGIPPAVFDLLKLGLQVSTLSPQRRIAYHETQSLDIT